ncbi:hypothetical protein PHLCEN_2v13649 [Hermanssonia centrifuga]|uniref:Uncharacterized protein n=1 Tax=Hermanssonia centrifuga TaxID=98765 RepID=A0A2R6NE37_9APHY|nr:hypothetical protein PHLCEN_2v13649 [Hermanssonia centrifuga]
MDPLPLTALGSKRVTRSKTGHQTEASSVVSEPLGTVPGNIVPEKANTRMSMGDKSTGTEMVAGLPVDTRPMDVDVPPSRASTPPATPTRQEKGKGREQQVPWTPTGRSSLPSPPCTPSITISATAMAATPSPSSVNSSPFTPFTLPSALHPAWSPSAGMSGTSSTLTTPSTATSSAMSSPLTPFSSSSSPRTASSPLSPASRSSWDQKMYDLREGLISSPNRVGTYLGDPTLEVSAMFQWVRFEKTSVLCTIDVAAAYKVALEEFNKDNSPDAEAPLPPVAAILCGVYRIDDDKFFLGPDGNWNPYKDFGGLDDSKATCLLGQAAEALFARDYEVLERNVRILVDMGRSGDGRKLKGIYTDTDHGSLLKLRHVLFEELDDDEREAAQNKELGSSDDEESDITGWPVKKKQSKLAIKKMVNKYRVVPLPAFGLVGDKIRPGKYETVLKGADVQAHFTLLHWPIKDKRGASDTMVADVLNLRVYVPARLKPVAYAKAAKRSLEKDLFTPDISAKRSRTMGST